MRGEYLSRAIDATAAWELPPRARRIRYTGPPFLCRKGTTSACAENTRSSCAPVSTWWNYLRVRGEYAEQLRTCQHLVELPPRARRILRVATAVFPPWGTTSACAENTTGASNLAFRDRNYLRVRGEYPHNCYRSTASAELPPRARRIRYRGLAPLAYRGTTSACAENTADSILPPNVRGNYLRVRGEYLIAFDVALSLVELPPRARRILRSTLLTRLSYGTTSACAENTFKEFPQGM